MQKNGISKYKKLEQVKLTERRTYQPSIAKCRLHRNRSRAIDTPNKTQHS